MVQSIIVFVAAVFILIHKKTKVVISKLNLFQLLMPLVLSYLALKFLEKLLPLYKKNACSGLVSK